MLIWHGNGTGVQHALGALHWALGYAGLVVPARPMHPVTSPLRRLTARSHTMRADRTNMLG